MQSFTTQPHERNYQGNVMLPISSHAKRKPNKSKIWHCITLSFLGLTVAITSVLLGAVTLHNQTLKQEVQNLQTQITASTQNTSTANTIPYRTESQNKPKRRTLHRIPISKEKHHTQPMPSIDNNADDLQARLKD